MSIVKRIGFFITILGLAGAAFTCFLIVTRLFYCICTGTPWFGYGISHKYEYLICIIGMLCLPVLAIGFLIHCNWRQDLRWNRQKLILLIGLILFFPSPAAVLVSSGFVPFIFPLMMILLGILKLNILNDPPIFLVLFLLCCIIILSSFYILASFIYKYAKNRYILWGIFLLLTIMAIFGKYYFGDVGGGEHQGNFFELLGFFIKYGGV